VRLFIAEKPSVARAIASHLPGRQSKTATYIDCGDDVVTWCRGHLLEDLQPPDYDPAWKAWDRAQLPMVPTQFKLRIAKDGQAQFDAIKQLVTKASVIVHAGDVDREGQLIVDEVLEFIGNRKPVLRLDTSSIDDVNLRRALGALSDNAKNRNITKAGHMRRNGDWLYGMNFTRGYTLAAQHSGYQGGALKVGRVKTPTMRLVAERDEAIENFRATPYFEVVAKNEAAGGAFDARWKPNPETTALDPEKRVIDKALADACVAKVRGQAGLVTHYSDEEKQQRAPLLFSLSALQADASKRYGISASRTLEAAQALYEAKVTSYPRTDCRYVPEAQLADAGVILKNVATIYPPLAQFAAASKPSQKTEVWNDKKVTAHHAIVPTQQRVDLSTLGEIERKIYDLIARAYVAQFLPVHRYRQVSIEVEYVRERFGATGRTPVAAGWKALYGAQPADDDDKEDGEYRQYPVLKVGESVRCVDARVESKETKPPKRFTEGTLIHAMANIHEYVQNPEIRKRLRDNAGIGTEATRAPLLESLKRDEFFVPQGKNIVSTSKARGLVKALDPQITDYGVTALFEQRLSLIAEGKAEPAEFMAILDRFIRAGLATAFSRPVLVPSEPGGREGRRVERGSALTKGPARRRGAAKSKRGSA
jgi:DNA topoisomerase-3